MCTTTTTFDDEESKIELNTHVDPSSSTNLFDSRVTQAQSVPPWSTVHRERACTRGGQIERPPTVRRLTLQRQFSTLDGRLRLPFGSSSAGLCDIPGISCPHTTRFGDLDLGKCSSAFCPLFLQRPDQCRCPVARYVLLMHAYAGWWRCY